MELCCYPQKKMLRVFEIEAISIPIVYNKYGDHDPDGLLYVLKKDARRIKENALKNFHQEIPQPYEEVKPLVIRANLGMPSGKVYFSSMIWQMQQAVKRNQYTRPFRCHYHRSAGVLLV